jgi:dipeptide transport system ATP-binding protein
MTGSSVVLRARGLVLTYPVSRGPFRRPETLRALEGVSFSIPAGRTLAVVGESGCGKSTLGRVCAMIEKPCAGQLRIDGLDACAPHRQDRQRLRRAVQMVFQDPYASLNPRETIGGIVGEALAINSLLSPAKRREEVAAMLARVGLSPDLARRYPHMLSGGQRQRVAIARALILRPRLVIADEPTSALDMSIRAQVMNLLIDLQQDFHVAYLFISHDLPLVRHIADRVLVLYLGRVAEYGRIETVFARPRHPYTRALLAAAPRVDGGPRPTHRPLPGEPPSPLDPPSGCVFRTRCPHATALCAEAPPRSRQLDERLVACHHADYV